jgi:tetratricopeptide (TPR) repeat protein
MKNLKTISIIISAVLLLSLTACEDFLDKKPDQLTPDEAIQTPQDLQEVLNSVYDIVANTYDGRLQNMGELLGDNLARPNQNDDFTEIWQRNTIFFNGTVGDGFRQCYRTILRANTVMENIGNVGLSDSEALRIESEAKFLRALAHFDAVRLFAQPYGFTDANNHFGVAIRTSTRPDALPRPTVAAVYNQILADLAFAEANLPDVNDANKGVYADKWAAKALLSRVYFQMHEYELAASYATEVIESSPYQLQDTLSFYTWPQKSSEAIFMVYSAPRGENVSDNRSGAFRGSYSTLGNTTLRMQPDFYTGATSNGGPRAGFYVQVQQDESTFFLTNIFNADNFHIPILTITEMMLTRAEALSYLNVNLNTAVNDINLIRSRAYGNDLFNLPESATSDQIRSAARTERRFELAFTGDRTQQLKRRGAEGEDILIRNAPWDCPGMALQFPVTEQVDGFPLNPTGGCN